MLIDAGSPAGRWNIGLYVSDRATYQRFNSTEGDNRPLPDGMGVFTMLGS